MHDEYTEERSTSQAYLSRQSTQKHTDKGGVKAQEPLRRVNERVLTLALGVDVGYRTKEVKLSFSPRPTAWVWRQQREDQQQKPETFVVDGFAAEQGRGGFER